ncbi:MAG TPA: immunoglobulin domain-containing protein [Verrucomicrobiae bacterium]|nr:immunoglobulin domain-containing protein [Verrucomicrobiae bacterium]
MDYAYGVAVDSIGDLFIADTINQRIRKVDTNGIITTVAGDGTQGYSGDGGIATNAELNYPYGIAADSIGNLYIGDEQNSRIRKVTEPNTPTVSLKDVGSNNAGSYYVIISNPYGSVTSSVATLNVDYSPAPVITAQPVSISVIEASNALFTVSALGTAPIKYQWSFDGTNLAGGTKSTLILFDVQATNSGSYSVVITNTYGGATSQVAFLTVTLPPLSASVVPLTATNTSLAVQFQFNGTTGSNYVLEYTTNLSPPFQWQPVITNAAGASGNWYFTDTNAANVPGRFFRMAIP